MTADVARELTARAVGVDHDKVRIALSLWYRAIREAAEEGKSCVRESNLGTVRTSMSPRVYAAAREKLIQDGFRIDSVADGPNETTFEVSWYS